MHLARMRSLRCAAVLLLLAWVSEGWTAGLGTIQLHSGLGQPLRADIPLIGDDALNPGSGCITAKAESLDGSFAVTPRIGLARSREPVMIHLTTRHGINEPALNILVRLGCDLAVERSYQVLLDPVTALPTVQETAGAAASAGSLASRSAASLPAIASIAADAAPQPAPRSAGNARASRAGAQANVKANANANANVKTKVQSKKKPATAVRPAPPAASARTSPVEQSVLRMSHAELPETTLPLKSPESESSPDGIPATGQSASAGTPAAHGKTSTSAGDAAAVATDNASRNVAELIQAIQAEKEALRETMREERERFRQEIATEKAALVAMRGESRSWIAGLAAVLAASLGVICWLLWRILALQKRQAENTWNTIVTDTVVPLQSEENTIFNPAGSDSPNTEALFSPALETAAAMPAPPVAEQLALVDPPADTPRETPAISSVLKNVQPHEQPPSSPYMYSPRAAIARVTRAPSLKVEEISDVMELVDAWMAMHDPGKVLELLEPFSTLEHPQSPLPWLCLLDVYRALDDQPKYEAILARIKSLFNVKLAPWAALPDAESPKALADYPHVVEKILALWESDEVVPYLENLLVDKRDGTRDGFDLTVYRDLTRLIVLARDPARPKRRAQLKQDKAYAMLFSKPLHPPAERPAAREKPAPATSLRIRERPKYITASYERTLAPRGGAAGKPQAPGNSQALDETLDLMLTEPEQVSPAGAQTTTLTPPASLQIGTQEKEEWLKSVSGQDPMSPMTIKLHLALAYQDIGDKDGACLLLEEVVKGGTGEQSEQAKRMLARLAPVQSPA